MTEAEWMASESPAAMLEHLNGQFVYRDGLPVSGKWPSARKLRLFAVALCRAVENGTECPRCDPELGAAKLVPGKEVGSGYSQVLTFGHICEVCRGSGRVGGLTDPRSRQAVDVAERFADGLATREEFTEAWSAAPFHLDADEDVGSTYILRRLEADEWPAFLRMNCAAGNTPAAQVVLLRCIFNPFYKPTCGWRVVRAACDMSAAALESGASEETVWCGDWMPNRSVLAIARTIYDERQFDLLPVLADELEGAGCEDADILSHCRTPGPHVRGCWVIDMLLGKE